MTLVNKITAWGDIKVNKKSNICIVFDHMPALPMIDFSTTDIRKFYGYNGITNILKQSMPHVDTVIFDSYHNLDFLCKEYKAFYIEDYFHSTIKEYLSLNKDNLVEFSLKTKKFNYLSNKPREARVLTSCWIANNYYDCGSYNYTQAYYPTEVEDLLDEFIFVESLSMESKLLPKKWVVYDKSIEQRSSTVLGVTYASNSLNFFNAIKNEISPTVFSIVMEPVFWEHGCHLSEKYINAILGGTIPIVNGYKVYEIVKEMGFDTFEDIVDTSAQFEKNPIYRILNLLEKNKNQLDNAIEIVNDVSIQQRLKNNIKILENYNYNLARARYSLADLNFLIDIFK